MKEHDRRGPGKPTLYSEEMADRICEEVATSSLSLKNICNLYVDFPSEKTVFTWRYKHPEFSKKFMDAKRRQAELFADEIIGISDDSTHDLIMDEDGEVRLNTEFVARSRLRVDSRKWIASKLSPRLYGEKVEQLTEENTELKSELAALRAQLDSKHKKEY